MFLSKHFLGLPPNEEEDIRRNLDNVLSTKRGAGYFLSNFGLSDVAFRTPEEAVTALSRELEENIRLFEPRVELLKINEVYDDDGRRVRLVAVLRRRGTGATLRLLVNLADGSFDWSAAGGARDGEEPDPLGR
ncbi:MAG TPA: GPW/gp25 family protein [Polyangiaceae bacterium]|nr:GPW/gp25 family protein [Polyangiaceae bacterium]